MTRRPSLPGASELFRLTSPSVLDTAVPAPGRPVEDAADRDAAGQDAAGRGAAGRGRAGRGAAPDSAAPDSAVPDPAAPDSAVPDSAAPQAPRRGTGRQKHSTKITVYVSDEELLALEHARLDLRGRHGLAVDRGRVVREAIAIVLDDLEEHGGESLLVRRLREQ
ncbi:hypothetical protein [Saccharothrix australiensis]|uniref:Cobyrinic acid a,c-diamide synthase n=1 Tax=Saccharothrix australiensis TaxID=2072 RepID=A0A495W9W5_9PSEU|nr:hypothetical protein [Saccharothrix australiensis]RKT56598.1 hypothetical protein C8E97_5302 [Saccharothrix australiensis]